MSGFFNYFPSLLYSNTAVTNVIAKIKFSESVANNIATFYPYVIQEGERADQIAEHYYDSPTYDWVVYLSNNIVDPSHEWPKDQFAFNEFIKQKYVTVEAAMARTLYFRVNYADDDSVITTAAYDALAAANKKYWSPILGFNEQVVNYQRKELDLGSETNAVQTLTGTFTNVEVDDLIKQQNGAKGTVSFANSTTVTLKHLSGTWSPSTAVYTVSSNNVVNATINSVSSITYGIPSEELAYWSAVSAYDYEQELNESRKHIKLLNVSYLDLVDRDMKDLLGS